MIETLVRNQTLIVVLAAEGAQSEAGTIEWKVTRADGRPLPKWLGFASDRMLMGERPANEEAIDLRVVGIRPDGSLVTNEVRIQAVTGEIQPLKIGKSGLLLHQPFVDQIRAEGHLNAKQLAGLAEALGGYH